MKWGRGCGDWREVVGQRLPRIPAFGPASGGTRGRASCKAALGKRAGARRWRPGRRDGVCDASLTPCSHMVSRICLLPLGTMAVHLPPCSQRGSSHLGSMPAVGGVGAGCVAVKRQKAGAGAGTGQGQARDAEPRVLLRAWQAAQQRWPLEQGSNPLSGETTGGRTLAEEVQVGARGQAAGRDDVVVQAARAGEQGDAG